MGKRAIISIWMDRELKEQFAKFCRKNGLQIGEELENFMRHLLESQGAFGQGSEGMILLTPPPLSWISKTEGPKQTAQNTLKTWRWRCPKCKTVQYPNKITNHPRNLEHYEATGIRPICSECERYTSHLWESPEMELIEY